METRLTKRILVVEDDPLVSEVVVDALDGIYNTSRAETAAAAIECLRSGGIDAMLLDCTLPGGLDPHRASTDDVLATMASAARRPFAELCDADGPVLAERSAVFGWVRDGAVLPGGRWRVAPALLVEQLDNVAHEHEPLVLIPRRERRQINGFLRFLQQGDAPEVIMHPLEAKKADVEDGDSVVVRTASGEMQGLARVDVGMRLGALSVPHAWRDHSVNNLLSCEENVDGLTGMPLLSGVSVTVSKRAPN